MNSSQSIPVVTLQSAMESLDFIPEVNVRMVTIRALHTLGHVTLFDWISFEKDTRTQNEYVVTDPKWLSALLTSVVTVRHTFVKNGVILFSELRTIWSQYPAEIHPLLLRLLNHLDVTHPLENDRILVPCLLPDFAPKTDFRLCDSQSPISTETDADVTLSPRPLSPPPTRFTSYPSFLPPPPLSLSPHLLFVHPSDKP